MRRDWPSARMSDRRSESSYVEFASGATIFGGGMPADALYIVESGTVLVEPPGVAAWSVGPGELFGESALLQPPFATRASARSNVRALRLPLDLLPGVLQENPAIALQLLRQLAQRVHAAPRQPASSETPLPGALGLAPPVSAPAAAPVVSEPAGAFVLLHAEGRIALPPQGDWLVGRPDPATGAVPEVNLGPLDLARSLSRRHARLLLDGNGGIALREEPGVSNGTWINGTRLVAEQTTALKRGDKLRFGAIEVELGAE